MIVRLFGGDALARRSGGKLEIFRYYFTAAVQRTVGAKELLSDE